MDLFSVLYVIGQAAEASPGAWESLVDRWGWPGAILGLLIVAAWRFAKFAKPWIEKWFAEQIALTKQLRESQQKRDAIDAKYHDQMERFLSADKEQTAAIEGLHGRHDKHDEGIGAILKKLEGPK